MVTYPVSRGGSGTIEWQKPLLRGKIFEKLHLYNLFSYLMMFLNKKNADIFCKCLIPLAGVGRDSRQGHNLQLTTILQLS